MGISGEVEMLKVVVRAFPAGCTRVYCFIPPFLDSSPTQGIRKYVRNSRVSITSLVPSTMDVASVNRAAWGVNGSMRGSSCWPLLCHSTQETKGLGETAPLAATCYVGVENVEIDFLVALLTCGGIKYRK